MLSFAIKFVFLIGILRSRVDSRILRPRFSQKTLPTSSRLYKRAVDSTPTAVSLPSRLSESAQVFQLVPAKATSWYSPGFCPISVSAQVTDDVLRLDFQVKHVIGGIVTKPLPLVAPEDVQVRQVSAGSGTTNVSFDVDISQCSQKLGASSFWFEGIRAGREENLLLVNVEVCNFDLNPEYIAWEDDMEQGSKPLRYTNQSKSVPSIIIAQFYVDNKVHLIKTGENITIPITFRQQLGSSFYISVLLYDLSSSSFVGSEFVLQDGRDIHVYHTDETAGRYVSVSEFGERQRQLLNDEVRRVNLTVFTDSGDLTGVIHVSGFQTPETESLVSSTYSDTKILLQRASQDYPLPTGHYLFRQAQNVTCSDHGNSPSFSTISQDCSLMCWVNGQGISRVRLYKAGSEQSDVDATVYQVYQGHAEAFLNLGPAQTAPAGDYICEVLGVDGSSARQTIRVDLVVD